MIAYRAWADIDLDALTHNLGVIRQRAGWGTRIVLVVKADAYGHGAVAIASHAVRCGIGALGVSTSAEALELRQAGIRVPILVLGTIVDEEAGDALRGDVHIALHSSDRRAMLQDLARRLGLRAKVHLKIDTGMGRLGVLPSKAIELLREVRASSHLELAGVMTHVSAGEGALSSVTSEQARVFEDFLREARSEGLLRGWIHMANSACVFTGLRPRYDTVRPGIAAYGILPSDLPGAGELKPILSLKTQVVFLKDVPPGTPVGYSSTWSAQHATRIATLPVGYNDGVPWRLSNCGSVLVRGHRARIVGRVSMDYITVDVGHIPGVRVGDEVTLIGSHHSETISVEEIARHVGTISYEITCSVGKRVQRRYVGGESIVLPAQETPARHSPAQPWNARIPRDPRPGSAPPSTARDAAASTTSHDDASEREAPASDRDSNGPRAPLPARRERDREPPRG